MTTDQESDTISLDSLGLMLRKVPQTFILNQEETSNGAPESLPKSFVYVSDIASKDDGSIVVLGKSSLDTIHAQSLASYEQIRLRSMSMDCKSVISSLTPPELEQKLVEVLQENVRLKETLEQNNVTMKQHLNVLMIRQEELSKTHEAHREKFAETKNLVSILRTKNKEYEMKIEKQSKQVVDQETQESDVVDRTSPQMVENEKGMELMKLMEKSERQTRQITLLERINPSVAPQPFDCLKLKDVQTTDKSCDDSYHQSFLESFMRYNEMVEALNACYAAQVSRYMRTQQSLQRCIEVLAETTNSATAKDTKQSPESVKREELEKYREQLIDIEFETIGEHQATIKSQNEFQKILTDYNSKLLEVQRLRKENERLKDFERGATLYDARLEQARTCLRVKEKKVEEEQLRLEKNNIEIAQKREELKRETARLQTIEHKLVEANASLNDEVAAMRESNDVLREQLRVYEADYSEAMQLRDAMLAEKNELLDHIQKLEEQIRHNRVFQTSVLD